jgi:hypothetical protein
MAEGNPDTAILVAISFQAMQRLKRQSEETRVADTTVMLLFAALYLEGTIDYIVSFSGKNRRMITFLNPLPKSKKKSKKRRRRFLPGLRLKLTWFHNECIAANRCPGRVSLKPKIGSRLRRMFPDFRVLNAFRDSVAHGHIHEIDPARAKDIRGERKDVVNRLYDAAEAKWGTHVDRITTYDAAIRTLRKYAGAPGA